MADGTTQNTNLEASLTQFVAGVKDVSDALRTNSEVGTLLANVLSTTMDDKTRTRVLNVATSPGMSARDRRAATRDIMATQISKLSRGTLEIPKITAKLSRITNLLQRLVTSSEAMHSGLQSLSNSLHSNGNSSFVQPTLPIKPTSARRRELDENLSLRYSSRFNKAARRNPFMRMIMPKTMAMASKIAGYSDAGWSLGYWMRQSKFKPIRSIGRKMALQSGKAGRFAGATAAGSMGAIAAIGGVALLAALAVMVTKRVLATNLAVQQMKGRTGDDRYNWWNQTQLEFKAGTWGYSQAELAKKQMEFAKAGFTETTDTGILESGLRAEKYFGVDGTAQYFQTLRRSTDAIRKYGSDLGKEFFSLRTIVRNTGMGLEELQQHQTGFMDSFKGATTKFQIGQVDALLANFRSLLVSKETTGAELASFFNANQRVDTNTMLTSAWFADRGGYRFKNPNGDLLSKAFELRHMGSGDIAGRARAFQSELRGLYDQFGVSKFSQLNGSQKFIVTEQLMPQLLGIDVSKLPSIDTFMKKFDRGAGLTGLDADTEAEIKKAQETDTDRIVQKMSLLENPLNTIANIIMRWATLSFWDARGYVKDAERKQEEKQNQQSVNDYNIITLYNASDTKLEVKQGKPGQKAEVVTKLGGGGR